MLNTSSLSENGRNRLEHCSDLGRELNIPSGHSLHTSSHCTSRNTSNHTRGHMHQVDSHVIRTLNIAVLFFCAAHLLSSGVLGFNLDVSFPTVVTIPEKNSYFGYSVDMYAKKGSTWLLVGAPKAQRGEIYMCRYKDGITSPCSKVNIPLDDSATNTVKDMFGMTLKVGQGKELLACAPFFTQQTDTEIRGEKVIYYDLLGICYLAEDFTAAVPNTFKLIPCQSSKGNYHDGDEHGNCQAGLSAAFTKDGNNLLLGTAGSYYRQGSIMLLPLPLNGDVKVLPLHTGENKPPIPEGWKEGDWLTQSYDDNYLGYTVATGKSLGNSQLLFASAPRRFGYDLLGMVVVYDDRMNSALYNFTGQQSGEYFGCGLAAVDLNNDNLDDVIIGAPLYSDFDHEMAENGRVYVYYQMKATSDPVDGVTLLSFSEPVIIEGKTDRARFGQVIMSIGDINQDGYDDIAVGAPYATNDPEQLSRNDGSVFIFNGGPEGLIIPASQEIKGLNLNNLTAGFGSSISGEKDVDQNGYPDLFSGAYISDQAVLLRARPVVEISSVVTVKPKTIDIEAKSCPVSGKGVSCFLIKTCFSYSGKSLPSSIDLSFIYDIDSGKTGDEKRAYILDESPRNVTLVRETSDQSKEECVEEYAFLKVDIRDKLTGINVSVSHSLVEKQEPVQPILNQLKPAFSAAQVKIFKDCGPDDICQADLQLQSQLDKSVAYVGQDLPIVLSSFVNNLGEPAFLATLVVEYPEKVYYVGTLDKASGYYCTEVERSVMCEIANPMKRDTLADVKLKFQVFGLKGNISELPFKSFVNSTNPVNSKSNIAMQSLTVEVKTNIVIYNSTSPQTIFLDDVNRKEDKKKRTMGNVTSVIHTYEFINTGPSDIESGTIKLFWPLKTSDGRKLLELGDVIVSDSANCKSPEKRRRKREAEKPSNVSSDANYYYCGVGAECMVIPCSIGALRRQQKVSISVTSNLPLATILENDLDSYIRSELEFTIDKFPYQINPGPGPTIKTEITTKCLYVREPEAKEVQWWIIAIAVGCGLLLLFLVVFALWRCGFFKRKRKPETEDDRQQKEKLNPNGNDDDQEMEQYLK